MAIRFDIEDGLEIETNTMIRTAGLVIASAALQFAITTDTAVGVTGIGVPIVAWVLALVSWHLSIDCYEFFCGRPDRVARIAAAAGRKMGDIEFDWFVAEVEDRSDWAYQMVVIVGYILLAGALSLIAFREWSQLHGRVVATAACVLALWHSWSLVAVAREARRLLRVAGEGEK